MAHQRFTLHKRILRDSYNPFDLSDFNFKKLYRLPKNVIFDIIENLRPVLTKTRKNSLSVEIQVLTTIQFLASGSYQRGIGHDCLIPISQPSVSRCIQRVTQSFLTMYAGRWISFPKTRAERSNISDRFAQTTTYPGVLGCIDCTHIAIFPPNEREEAYKNFKGFHSLNVQMVCDSEMRILNVLAFPGSVHDQFIFTSSALSTEMERLHTNRIGQFYLLGDSGYASEPYMLIPILHANEGSPEYRYTKNHCLVRNSIERVFGVLKGRWRCLKKDRVLHYKPQKAGVIINCAILHNMAIQEYT
ncbi:unnamed protein product [Macrosiphum euphorbiae]|uniref:DDE Tnp4 domain-containing protein n=1 Tax=Macrosiphum euphorbiae TaxID=13131 RepID=A0AAV0WVS0_9HEMI|nr:unnamed protein product [Macrosiphum euphorbiae]